MRSQRRRRSETAEWCAARRSLHRPTIPNSVAGVQSTKGSGSLPIVPRPPSSFGLFHDMHALIEMLGLQAVLSPRRQLRAWNLGIGYPSAQAVRSSVRWKFRRYIGRFPIFSARPGLPPMVRRFSAVHFVASNVRNWLLRTRLEKWGIQDDRTNRIDLRPESRAAPSLEGRRRTPRTKATRSK